MLARETCKATDFQRYHKTARVHSSPYGSQATMEGLSLLYLSLLHTKINELLLFMDLVCFVLSLSDLFLLHLCIFFLPDEAIELLSEFRAQEET